MAILKLQNKHVEVLKEFGVYDEFISDLRRQSEWIQSKRNICVEGYENNPTIRNLFHILLWSDCTISWSSVLSQIIKRHGEI